MTIGRDEGGVTLIELVIAIVIIGVAFSGVLLVMNYTTLHSADPMIRHQALAIAEAYLEEIMLKSFDDPGGGAESGRADFDDLEDYDLLDDAGARDQEGNVIGDLSGYRVQVAVEDEAFGGVPAAVCKKVTVTVTHPFGGALTLSSFRTNY